jgi:hypothetical protein
MKHPAYEAVRDSCGGDRHGRFDDVVRLQRSF